MESCERKQYNQSLGGEIPFREKAKKKKQTEKEVLTKKKKKTTELAAEYSTEVLTKKKKKKTEVPAEKSTEVLTKKKKKKSELAAEKSTEVPPKNSINPELAVNFSLMVDSTRTDKDAVEFCMKYGALPTTVICPKCGKSVRLSSLVSGNSTEKTQRSGVRCISESCGGNLLQNTLWGRSEFPLFTSLVLAYWFVQKIEEKKAVREIIGPAFCRENADLASVERFYDECRDVCHQVMEFGESRVVIGGEQMDVEVEELLFGRIGSKGGDFFEKNWVVGGYCRSSKESFFAVVPDRNEKTLMHVISKYVRPGSIIHTDGWEGYKALSDYGYEHSTFTGVMNKETGAHTNHTKVLLMYLKRFLTCKNVTEENYESHISEYLWRKTVEDSRVVFTAFLGAVGLVYYSCNGVTVDCPDNSGDERLSIGGVGVADYSDNDGGVGCGTASSSTTLVTVSQSGNRVCGSNPLCEYEIKTEPREEGDVGSREEEEEVESSLALEYDMKTEAIELEEDIEFSQW